MTDKALLDATTRVALAGLLHDLGKFAERAGIDVPAETLEANVHQYCPRHEAGGRVWHTHRHAAYTAMALDLIEPDLPRLKGADVSPFAAWGSAEADDSLINAAARHHRPETFLQWVVATADRVASGFDREKFEQYNQAPDEAEGRLDHYTTRQVTLFEQIRTGDGDRGEPSLAWRYPLSPQSPASLFPREAKGYEKADRAAARAEYGALWERFLAGLRAIPRSHRASLSLWLDHFESLLGGYAHAIPSATAFGVRPDVSLYDHARAVAALAAALWRYHADRGDRPEAVRDAMRGYADWDEDKLLLVQGDLFGIQDFIFATGGETQRRAAKLLRGRSFYVGLLTECAALLVLDALDLPSTSQIINAAGKFLIVAPNTEGARQALLGARRRLDDWFLAHTYGQAGVGIAWEAASCNDFRGGTRAGSPFRDLMRRLFEQLEDAKLQRLGLCGGEPPAPVFEGFLDRFVEGACAVDGRTPAEVELAPRVWISKLAKDQIDIGRRLIGKERLLITRAPLDGPRLDVPLFGYSVAFTAGEDVSGKFGREAESGNLLRAWDFSLPESADAPLFHGYARRNVNAYVPRFERPNAWDEDRYRQCVGDADEDLEAGAPKTFEHLACDARTLDEHGRWIGVPALMTVKGDVDNLGLLFQKGLAAPSFARMAGLSRQVNAFFSVYLPWLCRAEFPETYTVFAGGDDFFLIGPWRQQMRLARRLREDFTRYVAANPEIHFSAGLVMTKPGLPVRHLAHAGEEALDDAKKHEREGGRAKDAVHCFGVTVGWEDYGRLLDASDRLAELGRRNGLTTGYLYGLLGLLEMVERLRDPKDGRPEHARWRSQFYYRTYRTIERNRGIPADERRQRLAELAEQIAERGLEQHGGAYRIALYHHLYQQRD